MTIANLLRGLLIRSANDAAVTLANTVGGTQEHFVELMNRRRHYLGLENTWGTNPHGLDNRQKNYSTARDVAFWRNMRWHFPSFMKQFRWERKQFWCFLEIFSRFENNKRTFRNVIPYFGLKTGTTEEAGNALWGLPLFDKRDFLIVASRKWKSFSRYKGSLWSLENSLWYLCLPWNILLRKDNSPERCSAWKREYLLISKYWRTFVLAKNRRRNCREKSFQRRGRPSAETFGKRKIQEAAIRRRECYRIGYCEWSVKAKSIYSSWKDISKRYKKYGIVLTLFSIFSIDMQVLLRQKHKSNWHAFITIFLKFMPENLQRSLNVPVPELGLVERGNEELKKNGIFVDK